MKNNLNDFFDKKSKDIKQLKDKIKDKIELEAGELKVKAEKNFEKIKLENIIPDIRQIIFSKVAPKLKKENLSNLAADQIFKEVFKTAYTFLPSPVRLIIDEETFVRFCLNNKSKLLSAGTSENENVACENVNTVSENQDVKKALKGLLDAGILSKEEYDEKLEKLKTD